uniref:Site-specific DNA endonuclease n=1 Tax=Romanomermis culicivorax TaxID=13658 RepID=A0A915HVC7_ROMCU
MTANSTNLRENIVEEFRGYCKKKRQKKIFESYVNNLRDCYIGKSMFLATASSSVEKEEKTSNYTPIIDKKGSVDLTHAKRTKRAFWTGWLVELNECFSLQTAVWLFGLNERFSIKSEKITLEKSRLAYLKAYRENLDFARLFDNHEIKRLIHRDGNSISTRLKLMLAHILPSAAVIVSPNAILKIEVRFILCRISHDEIGSQLT